MNSANLPDRAAAQLLWQPDPVPDMIELRRLIHPLQYFNNNPHAIPQHHYVTSPQSLTPMVEAIRTLQHNLPQRFDDPLEMSIVEHMRYKRVSVSDGAHDFSDNPPAQLDLTLEPDLKSLFWPRHASWTRFDPSGTRRAMLCITIYFLKLRRSRIHESLRSPHLRCYSLFSFCEKAISAAMLETTIMYIGFVL